MNKISVVQEMESVKESFVPIRQTCCNHCGHTRPYLHYRITVKAEGTARPLQWCNRCHWLRRHTIIKMPCVGHVPDPSTVDPKLAESNLSDRQKSLIEYELEPREKILWLDRRASPKPSSYNVYGLFYGLVVLAFAIPVLYGYHLSRVEPNTEWSDTFLCMVPILVCGGLVISLQSLAEMRKALNTIYVITDQRAIAFKGAGPTTIESIPLKMMGKIYWKDRGKGVGDILFPSCRQEVSDSYFVDIGFSYVKDYEHVYSFLYDLLQKAPD